MDTEKTTNSRGVPFKVLGVILIILGTLDCMLAWRGGFEISALYIGLLAAGVLLFCIGSIQNNK